MVVKEYATGTESVTGTEWSLTTDTAGPDTDTTAGDYQCFLDLNALAAGDIFIFRVYEKVRGADTQRVVMTAVFEGAQDDPNWCMPFALMLLNGWDMTLIKSAGTDRTITWSIRTTDPYATAVPGSFAAGTAGKIIGDNLNATVSSRATQTSVDTIDDYVDTEVAAILTAVDTEVGAIKAVTDALPNAGALTTIQSDLDDIQSRLPAALTADGNIKADALRIGGTTQTGGDIYPKIDTEIGAIQTDVDDIQARLPAALTADGLMKSDTLRVGGTLQTAGDIKAETAAIKAKTDNLPTDPADESLIIAATDALATILGTPAGASMSADIAAVKADTASIQTDTNDIQTRLPAALVSGRMDSHTGDMASNVISASKIAADVQTDLRAIVSGTADSGTTTTMVDAARTEADDGYWVGNLILFTSGDLAGQVRLITAFDSATDEMTFSPATTQPVGTHTYEILPGIQGGLSAAEIRAAIGLATANLDTQLGTIDGNVDTILTAVEGIKVSTDNLPPDPADESLVIAATDAIYNRLGAPAGASVSADIAGVKSDTAAILVDTGTTLDGKIDTVDTNVDAIKARTDLLPTIATMYEGQVSGATTTTTLIDSGLTQADVDHWKGRIIIFQDGTLAKQATDITGFDPTTDKLTFTAVTTAPTAGPGGTKYIII